MSVGTFAQLQAIYADHRVAIYPLTNSKTPAIRGYDRVGIAGSRQLAQKFADVTAAGFVAGRRNRLTVVDIDSTDEKLVGEVEARYGSTPLMGRTPSGGWHLFYRHNGEPRSIRPVPDVDILGAGNVVAPGSIVPKGRYELVRGCLDDLDNLPAMRQDNDNRRDRIAKGNRNNALFDYCRSIVAYCDDLDQFLDAAQTWADNNMIECLPDAEIVKTCNSAWTYRGGRKRIMNHVVESEAYERLKREPYALALLTFLSAENGIDAEFMVADGLSEALGWPRRSVPRGRKTLLELDLIICVRPAGDGRPGLYKWNRRP